MLIQISNEQEFILDFMKYLKTSKNLKMKNYGVDPAPMLKLIEKEVNRAAINKFENIKIKLIPGKHSFDGEDVLFPFKVNCINVNTGKLKLRYLK